MTHPIQGDPGPDSVHDIHPQLLALAVPLDVLEPDPKNARDHDERNIEQILHSFREHGQRKTIVVQGPNPLIVRAGNGTVEAVRRLGWTHIAAVIVDEPDRDAVTYAIRDNRTAELAAWNLPNLGAQLTYLQDQDVNLSETGWEPYEYEPLLSALDGWEPPGSDDDTPDPYNVPERRVSLLFTREQWKALESILAAKPSAELVLQHLRGEADDAE